MARETLSEEKKNANKPKTLSEKLTDFFSNLGLQILILGIICIWGGFVLYLCKVAQSNVLPSCTSFAPYTDVKSGLESITTDINLVGVGSSTWSTKIKFPLDKIHEMTENTLGWLRKWITGSDSSVYTLYLAKTIQSVLAFNFKINTTVYNFINSYLSETFIILLSPIITSILYLITLTTNYFHMFYLMFYNIYLLFSKKTEEGDPKQPSINWEDGNPWGVGSIGMTLFYMVIIFLFNFTIGLGIFIPITAFCITSFCALLPLFLYSENVQTSKSYGLSSTLKNIFKYKSRMILIVVSLLTILNTSSTFGGYAAFVSIVACGILYFFSSSYQQYVPKTVDHASEGIGNYNLAKMKECQTDRIVKPTFFQKLTRITLPTIEVPEVKLTKVDVTDIKPTNILPELPLPTVKMEKLEIPEIKLPTISDLVPEIPKNIEVPVIEMPKIQLPTEITVPTISMTPINLETAKDAISAPIENIKNILSDQPISTNTPK
jgi:hypothetical protein